MGKSEGRSYKRDKYSSQRYFTISNILVSQPIKLNKPSNSELITDILKREKFKNENKGKSITNLKVPEGKKILNFQE